MPSDKVTFETVDDVVIGTLQDKHILDETNTQIIGHALLGQLKQSCPYLVVDLCNVDYISVGFLGKLITVHREIQKRGGAGLVLCNIIPAIYEVFEITRLNRDVIICATREEALEAVKAPRPAPA